ncbi:hypothetical protein ONA91_01260 [Micromonospora sp. DR5-3]|uniref:hypothetical protein n=1 Tax=unclassified Micromonospora TaxID=2617518 RepID=UPI0011D8913C|nr:MULTISPECIES: hypothetical protein [unclassified Micromonospora]MCW3813087.1 hypothetical protein [Micromonospora sp. DR5-3]TYC25930.1 hypothetical protein FXF52_00705 [Micromonospora sp. MP36]
MTRSIRGSRRAALLLAGTAATSLLLSGCGAGQVAETAKKIPSVQGVSVQTPDNLYAVRGLYVQFPGVEGYPAGGNAALNMVIYNDSRSAVTVTVTTESARDVVLNGGTPSGAQASPSESATEPMSASPSPTEPSASASAAESASPSASPSESATPTEPARIEIPALGYAQLNSSNGRFLQLVGLTDKLLSGQQVVLTFDFGNGKTIKTAAPVGVPLTPAARPSPVVQPREEGGAGHPGGLEEGGATGVTHS